MCKYINFNNLRKNKGLGVGGVMVEWSLPSWLNIEKTMKIFFIVIKNVVFENMEIQKTKTHLLPQTCF